MGHPSLENLTPFAFEALFISNEQSRPIVTPIVKATYAIGATGGLELANTQRPVDFAGSHWGEPETTSLKFEPETAFTKPASDVVIVGEAHAPRPDTAEMDVRFQVGDIRKSLRVTGDRRWEKALIGARMSDPEPFETMPLVWERAFGGWDTSSDKPKNHDWEPRNPIGTGFRGRRAKFEDGLMLPNIESPDALLTRFAGKSRPAGCGFVSPNWAPRAGYAGTYDEAWDTDRAPLLPTDFDRRFFNAAPTDQIVEGYLRGDEVVALEGLRPDGALRFNLPGLDRPRAHVALRQGDDLDLTLNLDTLIIDTLAMEVVMLWRAAAALRSGPLDVTDVLVTCSNAPARRIEPAPQTNVIPLFEAPEAGQRASGGN